MKFTTILPAFMACSHAMSIPNIEREGSLRKRADSAGTIDDAVVPSHYIVVFKKGESESAYKEHDEWVVEQFSALKKRGDLPDGVSDQVEFFNVSNFMGYTGYLPPTLLDTIKENPLVDFVEEDQIFKTTELATQPNATWGLARISRRERMFSRELSSYFSPDQLSYIYSSYYHDDEAGKGVTAYVLDSGIQVEHPDFEGRAKWGSAIPAPHVEVDDHGHGTHVAGTLGGKTFGVAKMVDLVAVQIFDASGEGPASNVIEGIEFAVNEHQAKVSAKTKGYRGAVINLSIGGPESDALDLAVNAAANAGVHVVVAAGNEDKDACYFSPSRATGPITVGATDINDNKRGSSNYGACVDVQAPGTDILSAGIHEATVVKSGTSMACPHVAGIIATFMSLQPDLGSEFSAGELVTPADLKRKFLGFSTKDEVKGLDGESPNLLAYNGGGLSLLGLWNL